MEAKIRKVDGRIIFSEKKFNRVLERKVYNNNKSSCKIITPKELIGKIVYVVWKE